MYDLNLFMWESLYTLSSLIVYITKKTINIINMDFMRLWISLQTRCKWARNIGIAIFIIFVCFTMLTVTIIPNIRGERDRVPGRIAWNRSFPVGHPKILVLVPVPIRPVPEFWEPVPEPAGTGSRMGYLVSVFFSLFSLQVLSHLILPILISNYHRIIG